MLPSSETLLTNKKAKQKKQNKTKKQPPQTKQPLWFFKVSDSSTLLLDTKGWSSCLVCFWSKEVKAILVAWPRDVPFLPYGYFFFFFFLRLGFYCIPLLSWNLLWRLDWLRIHRDLPASAFLVLALKMWASMIDPWLPFLFLLLVKTNLSFWFNFPQEALID